MIRRPPRSTPLYSSAASDVYKRQDQDTTLLCRSMVNCPFLGSIGTISQLLIIRLSFIVNGRIKMCGFGCCITHKSLMVFACVIENACTQKSKFTRSVKHSSNVHHGPSSSCPESPFFIVHPRELYRVKDVLSIDNRPSTAFPASVKPSRVHWRVGGSG